MALFRSISKIMVRILKMMANLLEKSNILPAIDRPNRAFSPQPRFRLISMSQTSVFGRQLSSSSYFSRYKRIREYQCSMLKNLLFMEIVRR